MKQFKPKNPAENAFVRLHALIHKGYQPDLGVQSDTGFIGLKHPRGAAAGAPCLVLHPDGLIRGVDNTKALNSREGDPDCIYASDEADWQLFNYFLEKVPQATIWQTFDITPIWKVKVLTTIILAVLVFTIIFVQVGEWALRLIARH